MIAPTEEYPFPQIEGDLDKPFEIAKYLEGRGIQYLFGGKDQALLDGQADNLDSITGIDCSGFAGVCVWHLTDGQVDLEAMNSQMQGAWAAKTGFKESTPDGLAAENLYLFMLPSEASSDGIGHVGFVREGVTAESYGHHGPGSRPWGPGSASWGWQEHCKVWVLKLGS